MRRTREAPKDSWVAYARLVAAMIAGSAIALAGAKTTWFTLRAESAVVKVPSLGSARFPERVFHATSQEVAPAVLGLALLMLVLSALALLVAPKARTMVVGLAFACSVGMQIFVAASTSAPAVRAASAELNAPATVVADGRGRAVTMAGGLVVMCAALGAAPRASRARRVSLPETGPRDDADA